MTQINIENMVKNIFNSLFSFLKSLFEMGMTFFGWVCIVIMFVGIGVAFVNWKRREGVNVGIIVGPLIAAIICFGAANFLGW